jgi:hypothetical protein
LQNIKHWLHSPDKPEAKGTGLSGKFQDPCSKRGQGLNHKLQTNSKLQCPKLQAALSGLIKDTIFVFLDEVKAILNLFKVFGI